MANKIKKQHEIVIQRIIKEKFLLQKIKFIAESGSEEKRWQVEDKC